MPRKCVFQQKFRKPSLRNENSCRRCSGGSCNPVTPGVLSALGLPSKSKNKDAYGVTNESNGRRLELARWIAHPKNQLTARSIVNRVWQRHFGKPLAGNPNNFGAKEKAHSSGTAGLVSSRLCRKRLEIQTAS